MNHVLHYHHESWAGESSVKKMWIARRPNTEEFHRAGTLIVDLERPTAQEQPVSTVLNQDLPTSLDESIRRYITTQISSLQTFLTDPHVSPNEVSRRQLGETVETVRKSITAAITLQSTAQPTQSLFSTSPQPVGSSVQFTHPSTGPSRSRSPRIIPISPSSRVYTDPLEPPEGIIQHRSPARESTWPHPQPRPPTEENLAVPARQHKRTPSGRAEPVQEMHLNGAKQREYFERMQECCIEAAHTFYERHKEKLDVVTDRKGRKLCYTTHGRQIANKNDLTLPQWTHLLRRLSDAKGLKREMVSRIESFNGEIQPVDEVRHAYSKNKEKSDRDLLALVQITRCFCWQLRDWEKCEQLDDLYGTIEETIDLARRERRERSARQATWPFS